MARLGVNIDHVATLRQARGEEYPSIVEAARQCLREGADQITIHLREDRRHIQDTDVSSVRLVTQDFHRQLNLEMGCAPDIVAVALHTRPDWVCLVPEDRMERTTEGGLDLLNEKVFHRVQETCQQLKEGLPQLKISLFLEANEKLWSYCQRLPIDAVEIHTGHYARAYNNDEDLEPYWQKFQQAQQSLRELRLGCHAGHGLTDENLRPLLERQFFVEYNIGHWIVCQGLFEGLGNVVKRMKVMTNANR